MCVCVSVCLSVCLGGGEGWRVLIFCAKIAGQPINPQSAKQYLLFFFPKKYFSEKLGPGESFARQTIYIKCQALFSHKKKKKINK